MDYRIWKYELLTIDTQVISMPKGAEILSVANQAGSLCLWAKVDAATVFMESRLIEIIGTGNPISQTRIDRQFIGTVIVGPFVWHVFERI